MNFKIKINKKLVSYVIFAIVLSGGFLFGNIGKANAGYCIYTWVADYAYKDTSNVQKQPGSVDAKDNADCQSNCHSFTRNGIKGANTDCKYFDDKDQAQQELTNRQNQVRPQNQQNQQNVANAVSAENDSCNWISSSFFNCLLLLILKFVGSLLSVAATILAWMIDVNTVKTILTHESIYRCWTMVRDVLNIVFIFALLFSAFSTIFQYEKYSYRRILLNLIIMALLVNFSYPIARFIIDVSNVLMYYLITKLGIVSGNGDFVAHISNNSALQNIIYPKQGAVVKSWEILACIVFVFILAVTLLAIGILLVIRTVALALLIIFSPIAFVGSVLPGGALAKQASSWWGSLFDYALFGPTIMLMLYIATQIMSITVTTRNTAIQVANAQSMNGDFIATISLLSLPIIVLWMGIATAKKSSVAGAGMIMGKAEKFIKGAGNKITAPRSYLIGAGKGLNTQFKKGVNNLDKSKWTRWARGAKYLLPSTKEEREAIGSAWVGDKKAKYALDSKKVKEAKDQHDPENMTVNDLNQLRDKGSRYEKAMAIQELAGRGLAGATELENIKKTFGETSQVFRQLNGKVRSYDPVAAFAHIQDDNDRRERLKEFMKSNQFDAKKLGSNALGNEEFMKLAFDQNALGVKDIEELRGKSGAHAKNIQSSLEKIAINYSNLEELKARADTATGDDKDKLKQQLNTAKNVQMSYFAQTGKFHSSIAKDGNLSVAENTNRAKSRQQLISTFNKDNLKRINKDTADEYAEEVAAHMNIGKYKNALPDIDDREAQRALNRNILNSITPEAAAMKQAINDDPRLKNIK